MNKGTIVSHYEIIEQLGGGGMGVVYKARDTKLDRLVALKFLPPELSRDHDANARFMQEAKAASALDHPNICTIYEVSEAEDGRLFIAMAYYEGQTLKYRLQEGSFDESEALDIARQIAEGLRAAHRKDIVHRDIKPANVMVTDDGLVKILDFGLAKLPGVLSLTQAGSTLGTAGYMSPEQIQGEEVDGRTDLWSLGVVLFQMLVGRRPFEGDYEQALTYAILNEDVQIPAEIDHVARSIVAKLLQKDARERYPSAEALLEDLPGSGASGATPSVQAKAEPLVRKPLAIAAAVVLVAALFASFYFNFLRPEPAQENVDPMTIAVMPFVVRGPESIHYLSEGIVDLLSTRLDGAGAIRSLDPNALLGIIAKDGIQIVTPDDAVAVARRLGAGRTIVGNVTQLGSSIQISASLYTSASDPEVEASVTAENESAIADALDQLAGRLLAGIIDDPDLERHSLATVTTASFPALKAYLAGLQYSRSAHFPEAAIQLEEAVRIDSSFALAWNALAFAYGWIPDEREFYAWERARAHADRLPWRPKTLIEAGNLGFRLGDGEEAINLYRSVLADYPNDSKALRGMGETVYHYNPLFGRSHSEADQYFRRASELEPDNVDYIIHQLGSAGDDWDFERVDSLAKRLLTLTDREDIAEYSSHMRGIINRTEGDSSWAITDPGSMNTHFVFSLARDVATNIEDLEAADEVLRMVLASDTYPLEDKSRARFYRFSLSAGQGKLREAAQLLAGAGKQYQGRAMVAQSLLYGLPVFPASDETVRWARNELSRWDTTANPVSTGSGEDVHKGHYRQIVAYLDALLARRLNDQATVDRNVAYLSSRADSTSGTDMAYSLLRSFQAIESLQAHDYAEAIEAVRQARLRVNWRDAGKSALFDQVTDRFIEAEALRASGRFEDAIQVYRSMTAAEHFVGVAYMGPEYLGVADAYEQLGEVEKAIEFYTRFVRLWKDCDPELVPIRQEAQRNLDRLLEETLREPA